jgi:hypothetical protein
MKMKLPTRFLLSSIDMQITKFNHILIEKARKGRSREGNERNEIKQQIIDFVSFNLLV